MQASSATAFQHDAALLNARFESYKIIADDGEEEDEDGQLLGVVQESFALPGGVMGAMSGKTAGGDAILGYKEVHDRSRVALLVAGTRALQAAYIDENGFVILITLDEESGRPAYAPVHRIERDEHGSAELCGLVALQDDRWLISNGAGLLTMLKTTQESNRRWSGRVAGRWRWSDEGSQQPFRVVTACSTDEQVGVLLQRTRKSDVAVSSQPGLGGARTAAQTRQTARATFELAVAQLAIGGNDGADISALQVGHRYTLQEPPLYAFFGSDDEVVVFAEKRVEADSSNADELGASANPEGEAAHPSESADDDVGGGTLSVIGAGLLEDGLEEEDINIGHACVASRLHRGAVKTVQSDTGGLTLLAVPLPDDGDDNHGVVLRRDLDGLYYRVKTDGDALATEHIDTLPALSYVLASKRDASRVYVCRGGTTDATPTAVLAFEPAPGGGLDGTTAAGNLFVYYSPLQRHGTSSRIASRARSRVVRLCSDGGSGAVVGAAAVKAAHGRRLLLILCQRRLLVLRNVL